MRPGLLVLLFSSAVVASAQTPSVTTSSTPAVTTVSAETREPTLSHTVDAVKMATAPTIDGTINEDEWKDVPFMTGLVDANDGSASPEPALFWLGYDDKYIYFAAR